MEKIGIFGGTFDPVHFGHLNLAFHLKEAHGLSEVWWIPAHINPLKEKKPALGSHRLEMLKLAVHGIPEFKVLDFEVKKKEPSYTIETIRELKSQFPDKEFYLLLGDDILEEFMQWKDPLELLKLAKPLVYARKSLKKPELSFLPEEVRDIFRKGWTEGPVLEISSTQVRDLLRKKLFTDHLVPPEVLDYIEAGGLYC